MGFKRPTYLITFPPGSRFHGLEVRTRSVPFDRLMEIQRAVASLPTNEADLAALSAADSARITADLADSFSDALVSWNLEEDDGTPVPATAEKIRSEDGTMILAIVVKWLDLVINLDDELGKGSPSGQPYPEASLPMVPLSGSLPS